MLASGALPGAERRWRGGGDHVLTGVDLDLHLALPDVLASCLELIDQAEVRLGRHTTKEGLGVEDYNEALHLAQQDMRSVRHCLKTLRAKLNQEGTTKA